MKTKGFPTIGLAILTSLLTLLVSLNRTQTVTANPPDPARSWLPTLAPAYVGCGGVIAPAANAGYEREIVELVNEFRAGYGLPPLKLAEELNQSARYHATDMGQDNYHQHDSYDRNGGNMVKACDWFTRIQSYYSPNWWSLSENIAAGYLTPQSVMDTWINSTQGHRETMLNPDNWEIGVGYYDGYWVQDFGRRNGVYPLVINREAIKTNSRDVTLYIYDTNPWESPWTEMRLRNDDGAWTAWQPFQSTLNWTLSADSGERTVWAEMRSTAAVGSAQSTISSDSIYLEMPLTGVTISGPTTGFVNTGYTFDAAVSPDTATQPITYIWQTGEQPVTTHTGNENDTIIFAWATTGTHTIIIAATNISGVTVSDTHTITIDTVPPITASPTTSATLVYTDSQGNTTTVFVPPGVVPTGTLIIRYTPLATTKAPLPGLAFANHAFTLEAFWNEAPLPDLPKPISVTIHYSDADVFAIVEDDLILYHWDDDWGSAAATCSPSLILGPQLTENWLTTTVCRLGEFALFGRQWRVYLPLVVVG